MTTDPHSQHFAEQQATLLQRFRTIQATLLSGYESAARDAAAGMERGEPFAPMRYTWNAQAAAELRARMEQ